MMSENNKVIMREYTIASSREDRIGRMPINLIKTLRRDEISRKLLGRYEEATPDLVNAIRLTAEDDLAVHVHAEHNRYYVDDGNNTNV